MKELKKQKERQMARVNKIKDKETRLQSQMSTIKSKIDPKYDME
jgi:chaperonin cofactor prefoldin